MPMVRPSVTFLIAAIVSAGATGCAATTVMARPSPFPGIGPPASFRTAPMDPTGRLATDELVQTALAFQGVPYRLGGDTPSSGFDCSGFVRYVFAANHVDVPRTVIEQFAVGTRIAPAEVHAGDLLFFSTVAPGPSHVGIALGDGRFVHAPAENGTVRLDRLDSGYWHNRFVGARRLI